jgi:hypothetical protein
MLDLGINSESISFEVALEALGQGRQPFMAAIEAEKEKAHPSEPYIKYCEMRLAALDELQDELRPTDTETIRQILDRTGIFFKA